MTHISQLLPVEITDLCAYLLFGFLYVVGINPREGLNIGYDLLAVLVLCFSILALVILLANGLHRAYTFRALRRTNAKSRT